MDVGGDESSDKDDLGDHFGYEIMVREDQQGHGVLQRQKPIVFDDTDTGMYEEHYSSSDNDDYEVPIFSPDIPVSRCSTHRKLVRTSQTSQMYSAGTPSPLCSTNSNSFEEPYLCMSFGRLSMPEIEINGNKDKEDIANKFATLGRSQQDPLPALPTEQSKPVTTSAAGVRESTRVKPFCITQHGQTSRKPKKAINTVKPRNKALQALGNQSFSL